MRRITILRQEALWFVTGGILRRSKGAMAGQDGFFGFGWFRKDSTCVARATPAEQVTPRLATWCFTGFVFLLAALNGLNGLSTAMAAAESARAENAMISSARVPFVANKGQIANPQVKYYAKTFGGTVYALSDGRIVYSLPKFESGKTAGSAVITEILRDAFHDQPVGSGKSSVAVSSFIGNRPENWRANLPTFDRLDFGEVYEGVSLLLSAHGNNVEKIFVLSPGADPRDIAFGFEGASGIEIMPDGKLELQTALGAVYFTRPVAWQIEAQELGGEMERWPSRSAATVMPAEMPVRGAAVPPIITAPIEVSYALDEDGTIRFELGAYDQNKVLIIDPLLASTFIGGGGADSVQAMAVDSQTTNVYVAGYTDSSDFPTNSPYQPALAGGQDAFVSKFDANLGSLSASTYLGGSSNDQVMAIGIDAYTNIWLAGYTESTNFPMVSSPTPMCSTNSGRGDAFVLVISNSLMGIRLSTYLGGSSNDCATAMDVRPGGLVYIVGYTESSNFPVARTFGAPYSTNYHGARDAFVALFEPDSLAYFSGTFLGGTNSDEANGLVVTPGTFTNFVYVVGSTTSTNFPVTNGYQMTNGGSYDVFVSKLSGLLTNLPASTFLGGTGSDMAYAVGLDLSNKLYVAGSTSSTNFPQNPTTNVYLTGWTNRYRGGQDIFVSCLTNNVSNLYASTYIGGTNDDVARCLVVDSSSTTNLEYVYLAGYTTSSNFPTTRAAYDRYYNGGGDAFTLRLDGALTNMYASTYLGGSGDDQALALALAPDSNTLFVAGFTASSNDFPSSDAAYQNVFGGGASDGFITKFPASLAYGTLKWQKSLYYSGSRCSSPALTWDGTVVLGNSTSLYAFTRSGAERWQVPITSAVAIQIDPLEGLGVPAVGTNNVVYINTSTGKVYAITSVGVITQLFQGVTPPSVRWSSIAFGGEGRLFLGQGAELYSISANGARLWTNSLDSDCLSSPAISSNGTIYAIASGSPAKLYAIDSAGVTSNTWTTAGSSYSSPALETNGTIYTTSGNKLYAFLPDGTTAQTWTAAGDILSSPAIGSNGVIYVGGGINLYAFNTNGSTGYVWRAGGDVKSSPAISADGSIIVGATNGVYSFNSNGTTNWFYETGYFIHFQSPLIDSEGTIYVSDIFNIYAIYGPVPPADSAWPMFRHDALRTGNQGMNVADFLRPTGLTVSKYGTFTNYIRIGWNASSNALNYELWRNTNDSTADAIRIRRLTQTNYNDSSIDPGKIYHYWVKVKTPVALSAFSDSDSGGMSPFPPENVTASKGVPTNYVQVAWYASSNATAYHVYRNRDNTNTPTYLASTAETNYDDTNNIEPSFRYYYWVKATNAVAGGSGFSSNDYGGIPCWPPSEFSASQGAHIRSVTLSWNDSTGAVSYLVYRENDSGTAGILTNVSGLQTNDYAGTPLRRYYYWIRATNEFGLSGFSASTLGWSLLAYPLSVSASAGAYPNMIRVSWIVGSTSDPTAHVIFRSESSDPSTAAWQSEVVYNSSTATNYDDTAITCGIPYYYWVAAKNNYGSSTWTAASAPGGTIPATPTDLNASDGTYSNMVQVTWSSSPGATSNTIYRSETFNSSDAAPIGSSSTNYYDDSSALNGVLYYYWVKAGNSYGLSAAFSTFNSGWCGMTPPIEITAGNGSSTSEVSVTWSAAPNALNYELWRGTSSNSASASRLANNIAAISYSDLSANPGTVYYYWVKSKRGMYVSAFSGSDIGYRSIGLLDISVSDFVFVPTVFGPLAHPSAVSFKVSNLSALDMVEPNNTVQYDLYLSPNAVFGGDDYWIGGSELSLPLNAGASARVVSPASIRSSITIPAGLSGRYYVFVFANHCLPSGWTDPNLANNVAGRLGNSITVASATAIQPVWNDYDGDGKTDFALYQSASGGWRFWLSTSDYTLSGLTGLGETGYHAVPRDYDGDGKTDPAVYQEAPSAGSASSPQAGSLLCQGFPLREAASAGQVGGQAGQGGTWRVRLSAYSFQAVEVTGWGGAGQSAVPADYDGDGCADPAVYQEAVGGWRAWLSASGYTEVNVSGMGGTGWRPVPADYDGDGRTDPAVYQAGTWLVWLSASGYQAFVVAGWGGSDQRPVPADYDGDGVVDPAVYSASGGWRLWPSSGSYREINIAGWGGAGQTAVPGDYDGDSRVDAVVYWETMGIWRLWLSSYGYSEIDLLMSGGEGFHAITFGE